MFNWSDGHWVRLTFAIVHHYLVSTSAACSVSILWVISCVLTNVLLGIFIFADRGCFIWFLFKINELQPVTASSFASVSRFEPHFSGLHSQYLKVLFFDFSREYIRKLLKTNFLEHIVPAKVNTQVRSLHRSSKLSECYDTLEKCSILVSGLQDISLFALITDNKIISRT